MKVNIETTYPRTYVPVDLGTYPHAHSIHGCNHINMSPCPVLKCYMVRSIQLNHLPNRRINIPLLLPQKLLHPLRIKLQQRPLPLPHLPELIPYPFLQNLQSILTILHIQLRKMTDRPHTDENSLVLDKSGLGPEGCYHCDSLGAAARFEGLVFDVPALH